MLHDELLSADEIAVRDEVREFVRTQVPADLLRRMDRDEVTYPREFVQALGARNLLGLRFAREYGGRAVTWPAELACLEEVGVLGTALACAFSMPSIVGQALHSFGTEEQKHKYLVPMLRGDLVSAEALTEPRGGSDFFGATTRAQLQDGWFTVRGQKRFVVGAQGADFFLVYCSTNPQGDPHDRLSLLLIERDRPGVEVKYLYHLLGTRGGGTGRLVFRDVRVPQANLIGELNQGGDIFNTMMVPERLTSAGGAVGMGRAAIEVAARYADRRHAFGEKIRRFEGVSFKVAESLTLLDAARALNHGAARAADVGVDAGVVRRLVSEAKKFSTESAWTVINPAMQILGGIGYTDIYPVERLLRDCRLITIWTGTNEIMDLVIQHEFYKTFLKAPQTGRDVESDASGAALADEKVYNEPER